MQCLVIDGKILTRSCYNPKVIMQENFCYFVLRRQYALLFKTFTSTKKKLRSFTFNLLQCIGAVSQSPMAKVSIFSSFEAGWSLHKTLLSPQPCQQQAGAERHLISVQGNDSAQLSLLSALSKINQQQLLSKVQQPNYIYLEGIWPFREASWPAEL